MGELVPVPLRATNQVRRKFIFQGILYPPQKGMDFVVFSNTCDLLQGALAIGENYYYII